MLSRQNVRKLQHFQSLVKEDFAVCLVLGESGHGSRVALVIGDQHKEDIMLSFAQRAQQPCADLQRPHAHTESGLITDFPKPKSCGSSSFSGNGSSLQKAPLPLPVGCSPQAAFRKYHKKLQSFIQSKSPASIPYQ